MKNYYFNILLLFVTFFNYGQDKIKISFNDKISIQYNKESFFEVRNSKDKIVFSGNAINDFVFIKPDTYEIAVEDKEDKDHKDCLHIELPKKMIVEVNPTKITFENNIIFSEQIRKNKSADNIIIEVPVLVENYDGKAVRFNTNQVSVAGIGSELKANLLDKEVILKPGKQLIKYKLSGICTENSYLMFDFIDINNNIQSIPVLTPIID